MSAARDVEETRRLLVKTETFALWHLKWAIEYTAQVRSFTSINRKTVEALVDIFQKVVSAAQTFVEDPTTQSELGEALKALVYNQTGVVTHMLLFQQHSIHEYLQAMYASWSETYTLIVDSPDTNADPAWVLKNGIIILFISAELSYRTECYDVWRQRFETHILNAAENGICKCGLDFAALKDIQGVIPDERRYRANGARTTIDFAIALIDEKISDHCRPQTRR